jgi:hypothetical protein
LRGGARNPRWWDLDTPKVFRRPGTNFRYRREPPSNFRVCPLFGTPPSIGAPGDLEKPPKSDSFSYECYTVTCRSHFDVSFPRFSVDFCEFLFFEFFSFGTKIGKFCFYSLFPGTSSPT